MSFFNFRRQKSSDANTESLTQTGESVEILRQRAKHRLMGSVVLVLTGVIGFPLLFDTQPRPVSVDMPIEIPSKNSVKTLTMPSPPAATVVASAAPTPAVALADAPAKKETQPPVLPEKSSAKLPNVPPINALGANQEKPIELSKTPVKPASSSLSVDQTDRAQKAPSVEKAAVPAAPKAEPQGRLVIQVGAYADVLKARQARAKLEKAGIKTYTQVVQAKEGRRIRVRVGPYVNRSEAENVAKKIKALDLPAAILTLEQAQ